jgi:cobalamin synthase
LGTFDEKANARGSLMGMFVGLMTVFTLFRFSTIAFTWYVMIGACVTYAVGATVSRLRPEPAREGSGRQLAKQ